VTDCIVVGSDSFPLALSQYGNDAVRCGGISAADNEATRGAALAAAMIGETKRTDETFVLAK
jgi:hypothetical protein